MKIQLNSLQLNRLLKEGEVLLDQDPTFETTSDPDKVLHVYHAGEPAGVSAVAMLQDGCVKLYLDQRSWPNKTISYVLGYADSAYSADRLCLALVRNVDAVKKAYREPAQGRNGFAVIVTTTNRTSLFKEHLQWFGFGVLKGIRPETSAEPIRACTVYAPAEVE